jgi:hypothetical protein
MHLVSTIVLARVIQVLCVLKMLIVILRSAAGPRSLSPSRIVSESSLPTIREIDRDEGPTDFSPSRRGEGLEKQSIIRLSEDRLGLAPVHKIV